MKSVSSVVVLVALALVAALNLKAVEITLREGTPLTVALVRDMTSENMREGDRVDFELAAPLVVGDTMVIPEGAVAWGAVQRIKTGDKEGSLRFDIEGVRTPDLKEIKLRTKPVAPGRAYRDRIEIKSVLGTSRDGRAVVGARKGTQFTAYVAETLTLEVAASAPAAAPLVAPAGASSSPGTAPADAPATPAPVPAQETVMVEFFSDPSGADILLDGDFVGNTPSILKLPVRNHQVQMQLAGYKKWEGPLEIQSGSRTVSLRPVLEKQQ